ncbi:MAG TPA: 3-oxoacyl-[acyl-carrier-protein] synthase III C-terminal domain-containing protein [Rhizomicrobium sp.]|jgi:alkylresorcinol/alkylpyrone synthase|nr:3-oxoacyl-[acyl-carrier-protein] synthase III C-terminal domain-containing protein [Rhizomicrobium sp.]
MAANPRLIALQTAVPPYPVDQTYAGKRAALLFEGHPEVLRLLSVFGNTGIDTRYSCVPIDWYTEPHGWKERTELYLAHSVDLLEQVTLACLAEAHLDRDDIDAVVVASTTGIATPSLDALLIERMSLRRDIMRLPIFGFGCAGGVFGLARAADLARATPGARVLFLVVELCALTFRKDDLSKSNIVAAALFGDGAAGAIISASGNGPMIGASGSYTWPNSLDIMGWEVEEDGLKARFAQSIPSLVASDFRAIANGFLRKNDIPLKGIEGFACHPGGAKVLDALEDALDLPRGTLEDSRATLRDYGNMSAATALFVLHRMRARRFTGRTLMSALGPGFSAAFLMLEQQ